MSSGSNNSKTRKMGIKHDSKDQRMKAFPEPGTTDDKIRQFLDEILGLKATRVVFCTLKHLVLISN